MEWSLTTRRRLEVEKHFLLKYFPTLSWVNQTDAEKTRIEGPIRTNANNTFTLRIYVPPAFPADCPDMTVAHPAPMRDYFGNAMTDYSGSMHTLGTRDGGTKICHYVPSNWAPKNTLYLVALKGRIWLEAYDAHRRTGKPMDAYLRHMEQTGSGGGNVSTDESLFLRALRAFLT